MRAKVWEVTAALLGALLALTLLLGGAVPQAMVVSSLTVVWFASRLVIASRPDMVGDRYLERRASVELVSSIAMALVLLTVIAVTFAGALAGWGHDTQGQFLFFALVGLMLFLQRDIETRMDRFDRVMFGLESEQLVRSELAQLREEGWEVIDNWYRDDRRGNVDHAVRGARSAFAIETKSGPYRSRYLSQTIGNAIWLKTKWHRPWVTAVICVNDEVQEPVEKFVGKSSAWVVDRRQLVSWLREHEQLRR